MSKTNVFKSISRMSNLNLEIFKLNKLISRNPNNADALKELGAIYHYLHENRIAIKVYNKALAIDNKDSETHAYIGYLYYEIGDLAKSIESFNISLDLDPKSSFVYFLLGNSYSRLGKVKDAVSSYDMALMLGIDVYRAHMDFAVRYEDMNRKYKALNEYKYAYEIGPKSRTLVLKIKELEKSLVTSEEKVYI